MSFFVKVNSTRLCPFIELHPGQINEYLAVVLPRDKTLGDVIPERLLGRALPVVPRITGLSFLQTLGLQAVKRPSVAVCISPWIGLDVVSFSGPGAECVPLNSGHRNIKVHIFKTFYICLVIGRFSAKSHFQSPCENGEEHARFPPRKLKNHQPSPTNLRIYVCKRKSNVR